MRVVFITQGITRLTFPLLGSKFEIVGVVENAGRKGVENNNLLVKLLRVFFKFFTPKRKLELKYLKYLAESKNIPYFYMDNGCDEILEGWIKSLDPDVILVFSMSELLTENIFSIPKSGTINLHPSFLPDYRGPNPDFWQYYNMEMNPGMTVHYIDKGEDTGDIINQERVHIPLGTKSPERLNKLHGELGVHLVFDTLEHIMQNKVSRKKQQELPTSARAKLIKKNQHKELIDWQSWQIERVWHILRGTELWLNTLTSPSLFSIWYTGLRWNVGGMKKCRTDNYELAKVYKTKEGYFVACSDGIISLSIEFNFKAFILGLLKKQ